MCSTIKGGQYMKTAIKYVYDANLFYILKKHYCPHCGNRLQLKYDSKIINSKSPEAKDYDFSLVDSYLVGDVEFRTRYFYCSNCKMKISVREMKSIEKKR